MSAATVRTHEAYIHDVRSLAIARVGDDRLRQRLVDAKVIYGVGGVRSARGVTYYGAWQNGNTHDVVEVCASCEESDVQIAGTTIHELGHVLAGNTAGHGSAWKQACAVLGLVDAEAGGQQYQAASFDPALWSQIDALELPTDGKPVMRATLGGVGMPAPSTPRPCPMGIGTRGGKSRGVGSGSRLRLWECSCVPAVKVRIASDDFRATCGRCDQPFQRIEKGGDA